MPGIEGRRLHIHAAQKVHRRLLNHRQERRCPLIETLAKRHHRRGHRRNTQRFDKEVVVANVLERLEVALPETQQTDVAPQHIAMCNAMAQCHLPVNPLRQATVPVQCHAYQRKARVRGEIRLRSLDNEVAHCSPRK